MFSAKMETGFSDDAWNGSKVGAKISINRPAYTQNSMVTAFNLQWEEEPNLKDKMKKCVEDQLTCTAECWKERLLSFFPFVRIMRSYEWRRWLILDLISGLSKSVVHIPQGMGFALLTSVPPVYGLYSSLFPPLIYFFFGTSRHLSMGTMALISLMVGSVVNREAERIGSVGGMSAEQNATILANATIGPEAENVEVKVSIALSISLLVGCFQFLMGIVGLGSVAMFMSMPFIGSFLTASAVHIITSQIPAILGLAIQRHSGLFKLPFTFMSIFYEIERTNLPALGMGLVCLAVLIVLKNVINERCRSRMKTPIPAELIVVVLGTLLSHYLLLNQKYGIKVIGPIPSGIPAPRAPPMVGIPYYVGEAVIIAIISFVISISMAKLMAKKHGYAIDVNQELYAYGLCNAIGAFFNCFAGAQAPPRTLLHDSIGGKTQLSALFSCFVVLLVCLFLGKLFHSLPIPVLAAVIIVALLPMFKQFQQLPTLWRVNKYDFFVWIVTFLSGVFLDITTGLIVGMATSIVFVVIQAHLASGTTLVSLDHSELYLNKERLLSDRIVEHPGIRVFRFGAPLFFANVEKFKTHLYRNVVPSDGASQDNDPRLISMVTVDDRETVPNGRTVTTTTTGQDFVQSGEVVMTVGQLFDEGEDVSWVEEPANHDFLNEKRSGHRSVILDCAAISYIDIMGINTLKMIKEDFLKQDVSFSLACVSLSMIKRLEAAGAFSFVSDAKTDSTFTIYPTVQDAVAMETMKACRK